MIKQLKLSQILVYYDIPEIIVAKDEVGTNYLCLLVESEAENVLYISTAISTNRLSSFIVGKFDLKEIFAHPETNQFYYFEKIDELITAHYWEKGPIPEDYLPDEGFFYQKETEENKLIINEAIEKNNAIVHLAISDLNDSYSIEAEYLGDFMKLYQSVIENTYKKAISKQNVKDKKNLYIPQNYKLRAFASSYGSFNIHLYSTAQMSLFGNSIIELGLSQFEDLLSGYDETENYLEKLRSIKGHSIGSFKKMVKKLIDNDLKIKHKWYSPGLDRVRYSVIDKTKAELIYSILNSSEELAEEIKTFEGVFVQVDINKGTWRVYCENEDKEFRGESSNDLLQGVIVETTTYKLTCKEIIEELKVIEKEKAHYILQNLEKI